VHSSGQEQKIANVAAQIMSHARSLNVFGEFEQMPPLMNFRSLRVLDLREGSTCWLGNKQIQTIGSLSRLRYLRLDSRGITELPEEIGKLQYLETLDLRKCSITTLPSTMVWLRKLLRLFVHEETLVLPANVFGTMQTLEEVSSISHVDNPMKFAEELGHLTKLKKLYMPCSLALFRAKIGDYLE
jgi:disease resistance protein RPM1